MNEKKSIIKHINSISELHRLLGLPRPKHTLITLIDHSIPTSFQTPGNYRLILNFYNLSIKRSFKGKLKYGKNFYDFDEGTMSFMAPNQSLAILDELERDLKGWSLLFHPDLIEGYPLAKSIKKYGFFNYEVNEALHLSDEEEKIVEAIIDTIRIEIYSRMDSHSQEIVVKNLDLLLSNCSRFYGRQFLSRKSPSTDLLARFEHLIDDHFKNIPANKLLTVEKLASGLNVSPAYLSDMLRKFTGMNTQQHIHQKMIEIAKDRLSTTNLTVNEIAFQLGFEYSQSFSKLFKQNTDQTPLGFRRSFN